MELAMMFSWEAFQALLAIPAALQSIRDLLRSSNIEDKQDQIGSSTQIQVSTLNEVEKIESSLAKFAVVGLWFHPSLRCMGTRRNSCYVSVA
jgi:hypothetical protein